ncbi:MAG: O-antigen ligase family protein [Candidatus Goldbacteria bacterium]|nr:O-antigen ligase family protein [Candidatus Goldiibacteriota bacterium]
MNHIIMDYKVTHGKYDLLLKLIILFIFVVSVISFWQPFFDPFGPVQLMIIRIFIPLFIILYLFLNLEKNQILLKINPLLYPLIGYLIISFISIFIALDKEIAFKYFIELFLFIVGSYFISSILDKKFLNKLIIFILFIHVTISFYGILQHFNLDFFKWNTNFAGRPMGTIGNPDFFAGQLLFPIFFLFSYLFFNKKNLILIIISLFITLLAFLYTKVIGAFIGFISGITIFFIIILFYNINKLKDLLKNKFILIVSILLIFILLILLFKTIENKSKSIYIEKKRSIIHRLLMWKASLLMIYDSPWLGKGIGNYRLYYPLYQAKLLNDPKNKDYDYVVTWMPHQNFLLIAVETGIFSLLLFLSALILFYMQSWKIIFKKRLKDPAVIGIITSITAILSASFFNTFYNIPSTTLYFFLFLFFIYKYTEDFVRYYTLKNIIYYVILLVFVFLFVFNLIMDSKTMLSNIYLKHANRYAKNKDYEKAIGYYEKIINLNPVELCPQMDVAHYYFAAEAYREIGNFEKAKDYYNKDLRINPYCPEVNNMLGALLGQMGDIDEAIKKLEQAIYIAPHYEAAYINLATAYFIKKDYNSVKKIIDKYIELNGENKIFKDMKNQIEQKLKNK